MHNEHHWTGWPGAMCLHCGCEDPWEIALADGDIDFDDNGEISINSVELQAKIDKDLVCPSRGDPNCPQCVRRGFPWGGSC